MLVTGSFTNKSLKKEHQMIRVMMFPIKTKPMIRVMMICHSRKWKVGLIMGIGRLVWATASIKQKVDAPFVMLRGLVIRWWNITPQDRKKRCMMWGCATSKTSVPNPIKCWKGVFCLNVLKRNLELKRIKITRSVPKNQNQPRPELFPSLSTEVCLLIFKNLIINFLSSKKNNYAPQVALMI